MESYITKPTRDTLQMYINNFKQYLCIYPTYYFNIINCSCSLSLSCLIRVTLRRIPLLTCTVFNAIHPLLYCVLIVVLCLVDVRLLNVFKQSGKKMLFKTRIETPWIYTYVTRSSTNILDDVI